MTKTTKYVSLEFSKKKLEELCYLNIPSFPNIPRAALRTYLLSDIHDKVLLSVSSFCDHGYKVIFNSKNLFVLD